MTILSNCPLCWSSVLGLVLLAACAGNGETSRGADGGASATLPAAPLTGCDATRRAAYHGGVTAPAPSAAPYVCSIETTLATPFDAVLLVGPHGTLLLSPASGLGRSHDNGTTWESIDPASGAGGGATAGRIHPWLWRDTKTSRVFFDAFNPSGEPECFPTGTPDCNAGDKACSKNSGTAIWFSDDFGDSWQRTVAGCDDSKDYGKIVTGPPSKAESKLALEKAGYASMVYFCTTGPTYISGPQRQCYRSLDGGRSYTRTADPVDKFGKGQIGFPLAGAVAPDGTVYVPHSSPPDTRLAVSVSRDEGDSWSDVFVPGSIFTSTVLLDFLSINVTTDMAGNVYAVWVDDSDLLPYLSVSRDGGSTWSAKVSFAAPGVRVAIMPNIAVKSPGYVAIAYYGSADAAGNGADGYLNSDGRKYDAYFTETDGALDAAPVFATGKINGDMPVIDGASFLKSEYLGPPAFGPDGSVWAAYVDQGHGLVARMLDGSVRIDAAR